MGASKNLRDVITGDKGRPFAAVTAVGRKGSTEPNYGSGDVRGRLDTRVITLGGFDATDSFKIRVIANSGARTVTDTAAFTRGTDATAAAIQAALRTATGDTGLTVAGTTNAGPFTITSSESPHRSGVEYQLVSLVGCSGNVTSAKVSYRSRTGAQPELTPATNIPDTIAAPGYAAGLDVPLGQSVVTNGVGQTAGAEYVKPVIDSAVGGDDSVVISATEDASSGTSGLVLYSIYRTADDVATGTFSEDADGDVTISSLESAVDYYVIGAAQTEVASGDQVITRVGPSTPREYFTTT